MLSYEEFKKIVYQLQDALTWYEAMEIEKLNYRYTFDDGKKALSFSFNKESMDKILGVKTGLLRSVFLENAHLYYYEILKKLAFDDNLYFDLQRKLGRPLYYSDLFYPRIEKRMEAFMQNASFENKRKGFLVEFTEEQAGKYLFVQKTANEKFLLLGLDISKNNIYHPNYSICLNKEEYQRFSTRFLQQELYVIDTGHLLTIEDCLSSFTIDEEEKKNKTRELYEMEKTILLENVETLLNNHFGNNEQNITRQKKKNNYNRNRNY